MLFPVSPSRSPLPFCLPSTPALPPHPRGYSRCVHLLLSPRKFSRAGCKWLLCLRLFLVSRRGFQDVPPFNGRLMSVRADSPSAARERCSFPVLLAVQDGMEGPSRFLASSHPQPREQRSHAVGSVVVPDWMRPAQSAGVRTHGRILQPPPGCAPTPARVGGDYLQVLVQPHCASKRPLGQRLRRMTNLASVRNRVGSSCQAAERPHHVSHFWRRGNASRNVQAERSAFPTSPLLAEPLREITLMDGKSDWSCWNRVRFLSR